MADYAAAAGAQAVDGFRGPRDYHWRGWSLGSPLFLVIVHLGVDFPEVGLVRLAGDDVVHRHHGGQHGVVLVIVAVHAVAADQEQVVVAVHILANLGEPVVGAEVRGIGLLHPQDRGVEHFGGVDDADLAEFLGRQRDHALVGEVPDFVRLVAEILQAQPDRSPDRPP